MKLINFLLVLLFCLVLVSSQKPNKKGDKKTKNKNKKPKINKDDLPQFSLASGFYDQESIELEIKFNQPDAIIYYTLDGSVPNENSTVYENPFILKNKSTEPNVVSNHTGIAPKNNFTPQVNVTKGNVIRAVAKLPNGNMTEVVSGSYFVGLNKEKLYPNVPVFNLITDPDNLFDYEKGIYVLGKVFDEWVEENPSKVNASEVVANFSQKGKAYQRPVTVEYFPSDSTTAAFSQDAGIKIKGKYTRNFYQKSFQISANKDYGKGSFDYEIISNNQRSDGKGPVNRYKSFALRNSGNDNEKAKMRDMVLQSLVKNNYYETQQCEIAVVFIDGEYWGIYDIYEAYDEHYIGNNYNIDEDNVIVMKTDKIDGVKTYKVESGEESDKVYFEEMVDFIINNDMSSPANYTRASELLDLVGYAWYNAFFVYINISDGYFQGSNWAMWRVREPDNSIPKADGKFRMMLFDTENSTGLNGNIPQGGSSDILRNVMNLKTSYSGFNFPGMSGNFTGFIPGRYGNFTRFNNSGRSRPGKIADNPGRSRPSNFTEYDIPEIFRNYTGFNLYEWFSNYTGYNLPEWFENFVEIPEEEEDNDIIKKLFNTKDERVDIDELEIDMENPTEISNIPEDNIIGFENHSAITEDPTETSEDAALIDALKNNDFITDIPEDGDIDFDFNEFEDLESSIDMEETTEAAEDGINDFFRYIFGTMNSNSTISSGAFSMFGNSVSNTNYSKMLVSLLKSEEFKNMFINALCDLKNIHFEVNRVLSEIKKMETTLLPLIEEHVLRNGPKKAMENPQETFLKNVDKFRDFMIKRNSAFLKTIQEDFEFEPVLNVTITANDFKKGGFIVNDMNEFNEPYTGEYFRENILFITAKPNKGRKLKSWSVKDCKLVSNKSKTVGIYPKSSKCTVKAIFD